MIDLSFSGAALWCSLTHHWTGWDESLPNEVLVKLTDGRCDKGSIRMVCLDCGRVYYTHGFGRHVFTVPELVARDRRLGEEEQAREDYIRSRIDKLAPKEPQSLVGRV